MNLGTCILQYMQSHAAEKKWLIKAAVVGTSLMLCPRGSWPSMLKTVSTDLNEGDIWLITGLYVGTFRVLDSLIKLGLDVHSSSLNPVGAVNVEHSCVVVLSCVWAITTKGCGGGWHCLPILSLW